jgi:hypothetical protein
VSAYPAGALLYNGASGLSPPLIWVLEGDVEVIYVRSSTANREKRLSFQGALPVDPRSRPPETPSSQARRKGSLSNAFDIEDSPQAGTRLQVVRVSAEERASGLVKGPLDTFTMFVAKREMPCIIKAQAPSVCALFFEGKHDWLNRHLVAYAAREQWRLKLDRTWQTLAT